MDIGQKAMQDLFYLAATGLFFLVAGLYVRGCDRLRPAGDDSDA